ncbi:3-hydroxyacyl-CoA dehydrogenase / enoyl-CoA hydratase [Natronomonas pharaonis DSM 2160]|uniref:enoyl-CoA hydratase n=1 Tax=Natronomonas pharaonis (strain ATCC 35678 / DSM 2160 / CIP 103997 / JCM 8858 / NBRC 14720 / NCIMB 2260 / Gabara) TaxID=348780 RepID=A0A1U7EYD4_NATPD|nr:3-hydroxyacyl-CoA dehydrogenase/enoyl-CoA hydratase family protein [Natronomonas pharaonis]CAI50252.1 3-hydroxyacyl-CoA dehydrogenase / enoyl-CoA hydratase [Natronomonas pharaonis DSM 2160]
MEIDDIETIAVLGAGNMGHGIAEVAALSGYTVNLRDIKEEFVQDGYEQIEWSLEKLAEKDQITDEKAEDALDNVTPYVDVEEAVGDADFVIEAVPEQMDIKQDVYSDVEEHLPEHAIVTSNTSSLSITDLSEVTERPEQFAGMHFFNPPVRMQLVEVISGEHTDEETLAVTEALAEDFDKTPVRVRKDSPGFIVNRILVPLMNEACWMVSEDAATVEEIDSTTKFDMGLPMGSFELGDQVGHDVTYHVLEYMNDVLGEAYEPAPFLEELIEEERYGKKSGEGVYDYEDGDGADVPTDAGSEAIANRLIAVMANEVGNLVGNDVADPADIDEAVMLGAGFPDGPAKIADETGLDTLVETLEELADEVDHPRFEVSDGLRAAADEGGFHGGDDDGGVDFTNIEITYPGDMVGQIVLDREARMNTINEDLLDELSEAIDLLEDDDEVRALLITGAGDRAFSAGADVTSMAGSADPLDAIDLSRKGQSTFGKLEECDMPVVAGIDGFALGGGFELALCCDFRIASERSELGTPEHNLGLLPGWGGTQRLMRIAGFGRAKEVVFTAERFDPETMYDYDVVTEVVDNEDFEERAHEFAADLAAGPPISQRLTKRAMLRGWEDIDAGLEIEAQAFGHLMETDDLMEGITAFMGDGEPEFEGK